MKQNKVKTLLAAVIFGLMCVFFITACTQSPPAETDTGTTPPTQAPAGPSEADSTGWAATDPTDTPTDAPTDPTDTPTTPTDAPTTPTDAPTAPTEVLATTPPTEAPTAPTQAPTEEPTEEPTQPTEDNNLGEWI